MSTQRNNRDVHRKRDMLTIISIICLPDLEYHAHVRIKATNTPKPESVPSAIQTSRLCVSRSIQSAMILENTFLKKEREKSVFIEEKKEEEKSIA